MDIGFQAEQCKPCVLGIIMSFLILPLLVLFLNNIGYANWVSFLFCFFKMEVGNVKRIVHYYYFDSVITIDSGNQLYTPLIDVVA